MKKILAIFMCAALMLALTACSSGDGDDVNADAKEEVLQSIQEPENADDVADDMPVLDDEDPAVKEISPAAYYYVPFTLENTGFYMEIPSHWERRPASSSVYFVEPVADGQVPGRIVVTSKKVSKVGDSTRDTQLRSYFSNILGDFDTYEWSEINTDKEFMGDKKALWVTYSGTRDGLAYKGYVILGVKDSTVYVFHFRCAEDKYYMYDVVINRVRDSIAVN